MQDAAAQSDPWRMGAQCAPGGVEFRVWAPQARRAEVLIEGRAPQVLRPEPHGFFAALVPEAKVGERYRFRLDGGPALPDPASRFQPDGVHGASEIVAADAYAWNDSTWEGVEPSRAVLYELHVGTFTPQGTWEAAQRELPRLADLGVTVLEVMPIAEFAGAFGWGYDGVDLFAPYHGYGRPEALCAFVDAAHGHGLGVILDVVYNHFGPEGNYLAGYTRDWFSARRSEWGEAPNFDGPNARAVREFYLENAAYWIGQFHFDGLRFDATQQIFDRSGEHILRAMVRRARAAAPHRRTYFVTENQGQRARIAQPAESGGFDCDALWNDDFHHAASVALLGRREAYYSDYCGTPQELVSAARHGFLYQGQWSAWIDQPHGSDASGLPPRAFVNYLENHDQVANSAHGQRLSHMAHAGDLRALTALLLLGPQTPLLFQGEEYAAPQPFLYFADQPPELAAAVRQGRADFLAQFPSLAGDAPRAALPPPADPRTFDSCRLDPASRDGARGRAALALYADLLRLRREDAVLRVREQAPHGAVLGAHAFALRFIAASDLRLLLVNLGPDLLATTVPEPLLAAPSGHTWQVVWSSEELRYGGAGHYPDAATCGLRLAAHAAVLLAPVVDPRFTPSSEDGAP